MNKDTKDWKENKEKREIMVDEFGDIKGTGRYVFTETEIDSLLKEAREEALHEKCPRCGKEWIIHDCPEIEDGIKCVVSDSLTKEELKLLRKAMNDGQSWANEDDIIHVDKIDKKLSKLIKDKRKYWAKFFDKKK